MLPGTGEYWRDNSKAYFFPQDDNLIVITALWENHQLYEKLEIMRLDYNGNVLTQTIFDNPLEKSIIQYIYETDDGNYRNTCPSNFWDDITVPFWSMPENTAHPTQKPEKLLAKLILASSREGDTVFDPFLGSGTTAVTAASPTTTGV